MYTVVFVDDEHWALAGIRRLLNWEASGFQVIGEFTDPVEALYCIVEQRPHVVLTDIRMPELSGIDLMKQVREQGITAEFVIISGFSEFAYAQEAIRQGAFDYLLKPIAREDMGKLAERLLQVLPDKTPEPTNDPIFENENFSRLVAYIRKHYTEDLYLKELAARFYINTTYCSELFRKHVGASFTEFINGLRMEKACFLLLNTTDTIEVIAAKSGLPDYYYFSKVFKKYTGHTPKQYRVAQRKEAGTDD